MCLLSGLVAEHMSWTLFEMVRLGKFALILLFVSCNFGRLEWWACLAALGCSTIVQSGLAMMQVMLKSTAGVLGLLGGGTDTGLQEVGAAAVGGWMRGVGTIGHASNLACYLLISIPVFIALALTANRREYRLIGGLVALVGLAGLGCTLSRWPCALMLVQILLLLVVLVGSGQVSAKRAIGLTCVGAFAASLTLIAFRNVIYERITSDLRESLDFRAKDRRIALQIFQSSPLLGVGLNNYAVHLLKYDPEIRWAIENADEVRHTLRVRTFVALHNYYLFALAETGVLGLGALILFYGRVVQVGLRSVRSTAGPWKGATLGLLVGIFGVYGQGVIDFSFWVDPIFYTLALVCGMIATAPALAGASVSPAGAVEQPATVATGGGPG
jgi:O-antigen ligase